MSWIVRKQIILKGILQGIGFRPTVYRLAMRHALSGWVINTTEAVRIEIEGPSSRCDCFIDELSGATPKSGHIDTIEIVEKPPLGENSFHIRTSQETQRDITPIPPDVAICPECSSELFDPKNRRYLFPFTTCTLCGPRFTVVRSFPYDRERTSMADFVMCDDCLAEYTNPADRRFHSQTNSCSKCGPTLSLVNYSGALIKGDPIIGCIKLLKEGKIVAIKGIGGFHLAVDALNNEAVKRLRDLKSRPEKPFAVMSRDITQARKFCEIDEIEAKILESATAPIVLLKACGEKLAPSVASHVGTLGIMLPYAPVHHLLFRHPCFDSGTSLSNLVMTSGNLSDEPIAAENEEAIERLNSIADAFLIHNRQIVLSADDSIVRVIGKKPTVFRRSRGYVPLSFRSDEASYSENSTLNVTQKMPTVLGVGADLKNAPAILDGSSLTVGPHVGDLESPEAQDYFVRSVETFTNYLEVDPTVIAYDPHPAYFSSQLAHKDKKFLVPVYHHHAHATSLIFESKIKHPCTFVVFDGTGYGDDGTIWGGEFLFANRFEFERLARLRPFPLIGAETAIREPLRIAAALLAISNGGSFPDVALPIFGSSANRIDLWIEAWNSGINAPLTSSAGRLFDGASAIAGFRQSITFEGQAAMWLESIADEFEESSYPVDFNYSQGVLEPDVAALLFAMTMDALTGTTPEKLAARFHNTIADLIVLTVQKLANLKSSGTVGLTGGCFQNKRLVESAVKRLEQANFRVLTHGDVPVNDGGIAVGQVIVGREIWLRSNRTLNNLDEN
ncbi:MAG: carbamoyltransferase HypF [Deltaproteobacteria bacterium]|nr:carbamoyltransferase HypF [Deltaproteobacteria bacterium]